MGVFTDFFPYPVPAVKVNISNDIFNLSYFIKMPIYKTSGVKTGELRFFEAQRLKIESRYKIIFIFYRIRLFFGRKYTKKYNNNG